MVISVWNTHVKYFGSIVILKVQRKSMSRMSQFWALQKAGGFDQDLPSWYLSMVFGTTTFRTLGLYLNFERAKDIYVL